MTAVAHLRHFSGGLRKLEYVQNLNGGLVPERTVQWMHNWINPHLTLCVYCIAPLSCWRRRKEPRSGNLPYVIRWGHILLLLPLVTLNVEITETKEFLRIRNFYEDKGRPPSIMYSNDAYRFVSSTFCLGGTVFDCTAFLNQERRQAQMPLSPI